MAPSNGIIKMMKRGIRKSPKSNKKKNLNYQSPHEDPTDNEYSQLLSESIQTQQSPTSVNELDKALYSTFIPEPKRMIVDPLFFEHSTNDDGNFSSKTKTSSLPSPLHPLSMSTPTLSDETLITSNCKRHKLFHDAYQFRHTDSMASSSTSSSSESQTWLNSTPWDKEDQDEIKENDPSLCFPTHLSDLQIRPSFKHYLSLVLSSTATEAWKDEERAPSPDQPKGVSDVKRPTKSKNAIVEQLILRSCFSWDYEQRRKGISINEEDKYFSKEVYPNTRIQKTNHVNNESSSKIKLVQDTRSVQISHHLKNLYVIANKHIEVSILEKKTLVLISFLTTFLQQICTYI